MHYKNSQAKVCELQTIQGKKIYIYNTWLGTEAYCQPLCFTLVVGWN